MSIANIRSALVTAFEAGAFGLPTVYENTGSYEPKADTAWCAFNFIPNVPAVFTMGDNGEDEHTGIVSIELNYPVLSGIGDAIEKADAIRAVFSAGADFTYSGQVVRVTACGISNISTINDGYSTTVVTINWRAHTSR